MNRLCSVFLCVLAGCAARTGGAPAGQPVAAGVLLVGHIDNPRITESSGIVVSRSDPGVFWTHNYGGFKKQILYAITRGGKPLAEYRVTGTMMEDWEDIAADNHGHLFLGDIGNNNTRRFELAVSQVDEPVVGKKSDGYVQVTRTWRLRFANKRFDCESLFIWGDYGYVISKVFEDREAEMYRFSLTNAEPTQVLQFVTKLKIDSPVTGADISQDGKQLGVVAKNGAYVYRIKGDPSRAGEVKPHHTKFRHEHIEACTFVPEGLLATAESREIYLFTDEEFHPKQKKK